MDKLVVKPGKGYMKIALIFYILAASFFVLLIVTQYASSHDDTVEAILCLCGLPIAVGLIPTIIYKNVRMDFDSHGVVSRNVFGISKTYSWDEITKGRLLYDSQYRCKIYANGQKVGSAIFSYDGYTQLLDLLIKKQLLENSDIVEKAKRRASISQPGGLSGALFKNKR